MRESYVITRQNILLFNYINLFNILYIKGAIMINHFYENALIYYIIEIINKKKTYWTKKNEKRVHANKVLQFC